MNKFEDFFKESASQVHKELQQLKAAIEKEIEKDSGSLKSLGRRGPRRKDSR